MKIEMDPPTMTLWAVRLLDVILPHLGEDAQRAVANDMARLRGLAALFGYHDRLAWTSQKLHCELVGGMLDETLGGVL